VTISCTPYFEWCPGLTLDLHQLDAECGLAHFPIGAEIINRGDLPVLVNGKGRKPYVDHRATVARLFHLGVMDSQGRESLLSLKAILDKHIEIAKKAQEKVPFAVAHRVIQIFINRWKLVSRSVDVIANPHSPHGAKVYNADAELDDRKRKADVSSLTVSSSDITTDEEDDVAMAQQHQQAAPNNQDRQNPESSGGNPV
jgi:hypothetical protein